MSFSYPFKYLQAPLLFILLFTLLIPTGLPWWLHSVVMNHGLVVGINTIPLLCYLVIIVSYRPRNHNRIFVRLDNPLKLRPDDDKAGLGFFIALYLGVVAQTISVIATVFWG